MNGFVLIHGFTGSPASFDALGRELAARGGGASLHRPALLGHGGDAPATTIRFEQEVDRLAGDIVQAGYSGSHLCGYSLGARLALGLLVRHASLFSGATLIGVHPGLASLSERASRVGSDERWCELLSRRGAPAFLEAWGAQPLFASQAALPAAETARQHRIRSAHSAAGLMRALRVLGLGQMPDYRCAFEIVQIPIRLIAGERDEKFVALAREICGRVSRVALELVPGAGHNVLLEAPGSVARALLQERVDGRAA